MSRVTQAMLLGGLLVFATIATATIRQPAAPQPAPTSGRVDPAMRSMAGFDLTINQNAQRMIAEGRQIFRYDAMFSA